MKQTPMAALRRRVGQRVSRMTGAALNAWMAEYTANWNAHKSIISEPIKRLTGGFNSQSINAYVIRRVFDEIQSRKYRSGMQAACPECERSFGPHYQGKCEH